MKNSSRPIIWVALFLTILWGVLSHLVADGYYKLSINELVARETLDAQEHADDLADSIRRNLHYLSGIPDMLSHLVRVNAAVSRFGAGDTPSALPYEARKKRWTTDPALNDLSQYLAIVQTSLNADMIYVVDAAGDSIAASNWDAPGTTIGTNYAERDFLKQNKAGRRGMQYAVGKTTHIAGLYFSTPVMIDGKFMGAVVVKADVSKLSFLTRQTDAFVTDKNGVIILAHDKPMEMQVLANGALRTLPQQDIINYYQRSDFQTLQVLPWGNGEFSQVQRIQGEDAPHVLAIKELPEYGLTVNVENELPELPLLEQECFWIPLWISLGGSLLIALGGAVVYYLQIIRRGRRALYRSRSRLSAFLHTSMDGVVGMDVHGNITLWNESAEKIFGWRSDEVLGRALHDVIIPERYREQHIRGLAHFTSTGEAQVLGKRIEIFALHRDGREIPIELAITLAESGGKREFGAFVRDISGRKLAEEQLLESENKFRLLFESASDGLLLLSMDGHIVDINRICYERLGYMKEEMLGRRISEFDPPEYAHKVPERMASLRDTGSATFESAHVHRDGTIIPVEISASKIELDRQTMVLSVVRDISERKKIEQRLRSSEEQYRAVIETAADGFWMVDLQGRLLEVNTAYERQSGYSREELLSMCIPELEANERPEETAAHIENIIRDGHDRFETRHRRRDGSIWPVEIVTSFWREGGMFFVFALDITARKLAEERAELAEKIYQSSTEAITVTDENNRIVNINPAFTRITGYTLEDVAGKNPRILKSGEHDAEFYREMWQALLNEGGWQGEIWDRRKDGELYAKWATLSTLRHQDGSVYRYVAQFSDITEKKQKDAIIERQASYDALTGLPNRRLFQDRLEQELKKAHRTGLPLALLFLDLDRFKEINDTLGHAKGDILLIEAARRISECVRETDTVARLGGDEFTVVLPEFGDLAQLERIARCISSQLATPFDLGDGHVGYISVSIGITLYPNDARDFDEMVKHADQAMYAAKTLGRNCFSYFTASMQQAAQEKLALSNDLRHALARGELHVYYQPIVDLANGEIAKAEALLRWKHPQRGMVSPAVFIPLAEETGLIREIGAWVFHEAIDCIVRWRKQTGNIISISVNKSPIQFEGDEQNCTWMDRLEADGLPGRCITVEITEGLLIKSSANVKERLLDFRNKGIEVSLDDFGTGFSSLSYLKQFDVDYLKIDRSFISNLIEDASDRALTEAIIVMAHKLGIKTIAEGVETEAQRDLLAAFGCDYAQGFLYSPAVPPLEFVKMIEGKVFEQGRD